jgi:hypothetical protein
MMKSEIDKNIDRLKAVVADDGPLPHHELWESSGIKTKGSFESARRKAIKLGMLNTDDDTNLYYLPGQEELAREKKMIGSIGNRQKLILIEKAFEEIFMIRLRAYGHDKTWMQSSHMAERIEPILEEVKRRDALFPYSKAMHEYLYESPGLPLSDALMAPEIPRSRNWQKYCADVLEYCDRRLRSGP